MECNNKLKMENISMIEKSAINLPLPSNIVKLW